MRNSSNSSHFDDTVQHIITSVWLSFVFVFGTVGNLLLFAVILRKGRITNVTNLFNLNLAVGDLIRIFVFIPVHLAHFAYHEFPPVLGLIGCKVLFMIVQSSLTVSIVTLMFMSMERYQAVVKPLKKQVSKKITTLNFRASFWLLTIYSDYMELCQTRSSQNRNLHPIRFVKTFRMKFLHELLREFCLNFPRNTSAKQVRSTCKA